MKIFTIGFTRKTAEQFFATLRQPGLVRVVDVRLNNVSQLAAFTKKEDLRFFLRTICGIDYVHCPQMAPSQEILTAYKREGGSWESYEREFLKLMSARRIEYTTAKELMDGACLLCSEASPDHCHRRLVAEYLRDKWGEIEIRHLQSE